MHLMIEHIGSDEEGILVETRVEPACARITAAKAAAFLEKYPNLAHHVCVNEQGGSFGDDIVGTEPAHLMEHLVIELAAQELASGEGLMGHTAFAEEPGMMITKIVGVDAAVLKRCVHQAVQTINKLAARVQEEHAGDIVLVIPAYEPDERLAGLLDDIRTMWGGPIVIVDDGSKSPVAQEQFTYARKIGCEVLAHGSNRGKGAALKTAFRYCIDNHPEALGVVTADADGQHLPEDVCACARKLQESPGSLALGCRDFSAPDIPARSVFGNKIMCVAMRLFCGMKVSDTQTGLRGIPQGLLPRLLDIRGDGYEYEMNALIELSRKRRGSIVEVPITTVYLDGNESSHFNPILDSLRVARVFIRYAISSLSSSLVDLIAFSLFSVVFAGLGAYSIACATFAARVLSALFNFTVNRSMVFESSSAPLRQMARYVALSVACVCASALLVTLLSSALAVVPPVVVKVFVDTCLFFVNYRIQKVWVFEEAKP